MNTYGCEEQFYIANRLLSAPAAKIALPSRYAVSASLNLFQVRRRFRRQLRLRKHTSRRAAGTSVMAPIVPVVMVMTVVPITMAVMVVVPVVMVVTGMVVMPVVTIVTGMMVVAVMTIVVVVPVITNMVVITGMMVVTDMVVMTVVPIVVVMAPVRLRRRQLNDQQYKR